jgi:hypothetical protein
MRAITIQADGERGGISANDDVMRRALRFIVTTMPVGGKGFKFSGPKPHHTADLHHGTVLNHRHPGEWTVSFRPNGGDPGRVRTYTDPDTVVQVIIDREHN